MANDLSTILTRIILPELGTTLYMTFIATLLSSILGFILAIILIVTDRNGLRPNKIIYNILNTVINILRSFPFIILVVAIIPFTRAIVGTTIGKNAAIVPLTIGSAPLIARLLEVSLKEVDYSLIEAAKSFGATNRQIIFKVMIKESVPSIISSITLALISILGATAMAGALGSGGLGAVALTHGYQSFNDKIMYSTVFILIILVQAIQLFGSFVYKKMK